MKYEKLTESEEAVMKAIWDCTKEPELSDVVDRVTDVYGKDWKPQTVSTFLAKLVRKGYLKMKREGKKYTYKILVAEEAYRKERLKQVYIYLYSSDKEAMERDFRDI